jgi:hypothetical protein
MWWFFFDDVNRSRKGYGLYFQKSFPTHASQALYGFQGGHERQINESQENVKKSSKMPAPEINPFINQ